jgi:hypothetical protein
MITTDGYNFEFGDVWYDSAMAGRRRVCDGTALLAIAYDGEIGTVLKHGAHAMVMQWLENTRAKSPMAAEMAKAYNIIAFPVSVQTVQLINEIVAGRGNGFTIEARLNAVTDIVLPEWATYMADGGRPN